MYLKSVDSAVLFCQGFASPFVFAEDVMVVTASGYEKRSPMPPRAFPLFLSKSYKLNKYNDLGETLRSVEGGDVESRVLSH